MGDDDSSPGRAADVESFWRKAEAAVPDLTGALPEAWAFGATADHADELLELVLAGIKTGTASAGIR